MKMIEVEVAADDRMYAEEGPWADDSRTGTMLISHDLLRESRAALLLALQALDILVLRMHYSPAMDTHIIQFWSPHAHPVPEGAFGPNYMIWVKQDWNDDGEINKLKLTLMSPESAIVEPTITNLRLSHLME